LHGARSDLVGLQRELKGSGNTAAPKATLLARCHCRAERARPALSSVIAVSCAKAEQRTARGATGSKRSMTLATASGHLAGDRLDGDMASRTLEGHKMGLGILRVPLNANKPHRIGAFRAGHVEPDCRGHVVH